MKIVIATDIDGTLTGENNLIDFETISTLRRIQQLGGIVILVSSHAYAAVSTLGEYLGFRYVIGETGGCGGYPWRPLFIDAIPNRDIIVDIIRSSGFQTTPSNNFRLADISIWPPNGNINEALCRLLSILKDFKVNIFYSGVAIHIVRSGVDKGKALLKLLEVLGVDGRIIALGDGDNDIPLFNVADLSIAPKNASQGLKNVSSVVLPMRTPMATLFALKNIEKLFKLRKIDLDILKKMLQK